MRRFEYVRPTDVEEAVRFLAEHADDALVMGGGTAAVVLMSMGVLRPRYLVDLGGIAEFHVTRVVDGGGLHLGALTTVRTLERDPGIRRSYGVLAEAASQVANVRVRNMATVGGAVCYGEPQTDVPPALIALGATATLARAGGTRSVELGRFFRGPYETALEPGELLTAVSLPAPEPGSAGCHVKLTIGPPENKPVANASVLVRLEAPAGRCVDARIVMGAVGPVPVAAEAAASRLLGEPPDDRLIAEVAAEASEQTDPQDDLRGPAWYKRRMMRVLVEKALRCALQQARAGPEWA